MPNICDGLPLCSARLSKMRMTVFGRPSAGVIPCSLQRLVWAPLLLMLGMTGAMAATPKEPMVIEVTGKGNIRVQAYAIPLARLLDGISEKTGVPIRYTAADVPPDPVTLTCQDEAIQRVLRCVLGDDANMLVQHHSATRNTRRHGAGDIASIRILSSSFAKSSKKPERGALIPELKSALAIMARSLSSDERIDALQRLARIEGADQGMLRESFRAALEDEDGDVRAEALSELALLDEGHSFEMLSAAMSDQHASVRLAALDSMAVNEKSLPYLDKALSDPDESVRALAELRLGIE